MSDVSVEENEETQGAIEYGNVDQPDQKDEGPVYSAIGETIHVRAKEEENVNGASQNTSTGMCGA